MPSRKLQPGGTWGCGGVAVDAEVDGESKRGNGDEGTTATRAAVTGAAAGRVRRR